MMNIKHLPRLAKKGKLYYLASPFSSGMDEVNPHEESYLKELRYLQILSIGTQLTKDGFTLIEPIAMSHHHAQRFGMPQDYKFWQTRDRLLLSKCDGVIVAKMPGWDLSIGVSDEIQYANRLGIPVHELDVDTDELECEVIDYAIRKQEATR